MSKAFQLRAWSAKFLKEITQAQVRAGIRPLLLVLLLIAGAAALLFTALPFWYTVLDKIADASAQERHLFITIGLVTLLFPWFALRKLMARASVGIQRSSIRLLASLQTCWLPWIRLRLPSMSDAISALRQVTPWAIGYCVLAFALDRLLYEIIPFEWHDLWHATNTAVNLLYLLGGLMLLRFIVLRLFQRLAKDTAAAVTQIYVARYPQHPPPIQIVAWSLAASIVVVAVAFGLSRSRSKSIQLAPGIEKTAEFHLVVHSVAQDPPRLNATFYLVTYAGESVDHRVIDESSYLLVDGKPFQREDGGLPNYYGDLEIQATSSQFYFPFNHYSVPFFSFGVEPGYLSNGLVFRVYADSTALSIKRVQASYGSHAYELEIEYAAYHKILVVIIFLNLLVFLWAIWKANKREEIVELTVGVFAATIALRTFLIPANLDAPLFLDQVILMYFVLLMTSFLLRYATLGSQPRRDNESPKV